MNGYDNLPSGTSTLHIPRTYEQIRESIEDYANKNIDDIFEIGIKIKDRNIFWAMMMREKITKQIAFTLMVGSWTLINFCSKEKIDYDL